MAHTAFLTLCKKGPAKTGGAKEARSLPPDFDVNAGTAVSFSQLDSWFTMPVAFLNDDFLITPVTTDCHIRFSHTVFRAGGSNASFVANRNAKLKMLFPSSTELPQGNLL